MILKSYFSSHKIFEIDNIVLILAILYICLIEFRIFQHQSFSLADPVFILLFSSILIKEKESLLGFFKNDDKLVKIFFIFSIVWVLSYIFPVLTYDDSIAFFDRNSRFIIGSFYLVAISVSFFYLTIKLGWLIIAKVVLWSGLINALIAITGLLLFMSGIDVMADVKNGLVTKTGSSTPYLIGFPRLIGFSLTPNALAYSLFVSSLMSIPLYHSNSISKRFFLVSFIIIFIALALTISKTLLIFILTYTTWYFSRLLRSWKLERARRYLLAIILFSGLILYVFATHIMIVGNDVDIGLVYPGAAGKCNFGKELFFSNFDEANVYLCPSLLVQLKILYLQSGFESLPWGVGAVNDLNFGHTPHSSYLERFSLHGVTGILSLFVLIYMVSKALNKIKESDLSFDYTYYAFYLFWLMHAYMSINEDMLRYRILWVFIGVTLGVAVSHARKKTYYK
jgi:hypothetical protein